MDEALDRARDLYLEAAKSHPAGTTWGRRSTDVSPATPAVTASSGPESSPWEMENQIPLEMSKGKYGPHKIR